MQVNTFQRFVSIFAELVYRLCHLDCGCKRELRRMANAVRITRNAAIHEKFVRIYISRRVFCKLVINYVRHRLILVLQQTEYYETEARVSTKLYPFVGF